MKKSTLLATAVLAGAIAQPAFAQDSNPDYFNGVYVGGTLSVESIDDGKDEGLAFDTDGDGEYNDVVRTITGADAFSPGLCNGRPNAGPATPTCSDDEQELGYAIKIGMDRRIGDMFVAGVVLEGSKSNATDYTTGFSTTPASYTIAREIDYAGALRARLGISPGDGRGLLYATGGVTYGRIDHEFTTTNTANSFTPVNGDEWLWGAQYGAGAEIYLTDSISLNVEYLRTHFEKDDYYVVGGAGSAPATNPFLLDSGETNLRSTGRQLEVNSFRAGLNFRF